MLRYLLTILFLLNFILPTGALADSTGTSDRIGNIKSLIASKATAGNAAEVERAEFAKQQSEVTSGAMRMVQGLILCIGIFMIGIYAYRKITGEKPVIRGRRMRIVERIAVAPKTTLVLAEVHGREVLLAVGEKVSFIDLPGTEAYAQEMDLLCQQSEDLPQSVS